GSQSVSSVQLCAEAREGVKTTGEHTMAESSAADKIDEFMNSPWGMRNLQPSGWQRDTAVSTFKSPINAHFVGQQCGTLCISGYHQQIAPGFDQASREPRRAWRGKRSQTALSRRPGFRANVAAKWESGQRMPTANETLRYS